MSKKDSLFKDAIETAAESKDAEIAQELFSWFISEQRRDCAAAMLYTCYELLKPDYVLEVAWRNGLMDIAMPFMVQVLAEYGTKIENLEKIALERGIKDEEKAKQGLTFVNC